MLSGNMATEAIRVFVNDVQHMVGLVAGRVEHGEVAIVTSFRGIQLAVLAVYCVAFAVLFAFVTKVLLPPVAALVSAEKNAPARQKCVVYACGWPVSPCFTVLPCFTMFHCAPQQLTSRTRLLLWQVGPPPQLVLTSLF